MWPTYGPSLAQAPIQYRASVPTAREQTGAPNAPKPSESRFSRAAKTVVAAIITASALAAAIITLVNFGDQASTTATKRFGPVAKFQRTLDHTCRLYAGELAQMVSHRTLRALALSRVRVQSDLIQTIDGMKPPTHDVAIAISLYLAPLRMLTTFGYHRAQRVPSVNMSGGQSGLNLYFNPSVKARYFMTQAKEAAHELEAPACSNSVLLWVL